tara:strand:+ start:6266 stop:8179 length:1914 start_codon:yes stop_codon:yes gene_type:complete
MYANQLINEAEVQKTWGPVIEESTGITEKSKLSWMSKYCHYHNLNESVYNTVHLNPNMNVQSMGNVTLPGNPGSMNAFPAQAAGSGDRPFSLLPLAMQVAAQTVGLDLVPVVPMQGPMGVLTYLDFVYGGGRGSGAPVNGALDTAASPLLIKMNVATYLVANGGAATTFVVNDVVYADGANSSTAATTPIANDLKAANYELTFVGLSRIDGFPIFRVRANNSAIIANPAGAGTALVGFPSYNGGFTYAQGAETASSTIYNSIVGGGALYGAVRAAAPAVRAGSSVVLGAAGMLQIGTIAAVSGLGLVKALEDHITGFSGNAFQPANDPATGSPAFANQNINGVDPYQRGVGESTVDNIMGLSLFNKSIAAETFQVAAAVTREQVQDLKQFGIDAVAQVEAVLVNELTQSINKYILDRIFRNGVTNAAQVQAVNGTSLSEQFNAAGAVAGAAIPLGPNNTANAIVNTVAPFPVQTNVLGGGNTQGTLQRRVYTKILAASNLIATRGRRGPATFAVTGGEMATALQSVAGFIAYPLSNTVNQAGGSLYPIGAIAGVTIYVDPNRAFNDYTIAVGRKGDGNSPGLVFMPYLMAESVETIAEGTMAPKIAVKSRFALVDAGFNPELMYYTMNFTFTGCSLI